MYPTTRSIGHNGNFILDMTPDNTSSNCNVISYRPPYFTPTRSKNKRNEVKRTSSWNLLPSLARHRNSNLHCCILKLFGLSSYISLFLFVCLFHVSHRPEEKLLCYYEIIKKAKIFRCISFICQRAEFNGIDRETCCREGANEVIYIYLLFDPMSFK